MKFVATLLLLCLVSFGQSLQILSVFPVISKSHYVLGEALLKGLVKAGHEVTSLTTFPGKKPIANLTEIKIVNVRPEDFAAKIAAKGGFFALGNQNKVFSIAQIVTSFQKSSEIAITDPAIEAVWKSGKQFDVIIAPIFFNDAVLAYLANKFNAPLIALATSGVNSMSGKVVGNPSPLAYVPEGMLSYTDHMSFMERMTNTLIYTITNVMMDFTYFPNEERVLKKFIPNIKDLNTELKRISLVLANSHISLSYPQPLTSAIKEIGGFHVQPPNPLPADIKKVLDEAKEGVIFFSLGTNIKSSEIPVGMKNAIIESFGKIKQKVLWKWDEKTIPGLSKNVVLNSWFPQSDILAHPNVKLFITHGGLLSTTEAIVRGVPVLGIPIFADQMKNIQKTVSIGVALQLDHQNITTKSFSWALNELLTNPIYMENVQGRSKVMNDRMVSPMQEAIYWVEYVARHKGAKHLQSASLDLSWYQYLLLDVVGFFAVIVFGSLGLLFWVLRTLIRLVKSKVVKNKTE